MFLKKLLNVFYSLKIKLTKKLPIVIEKFRDWYGSPKRRQTIMGQVEYEEDSYIFTKFVKTIMPWRYTVWRFTMLISVFALLLSYACRMFPPVGSKQYNQLFP